MDNKTYKVLITTRLYDEGAKQAIEYYCSVTYGNGDNLQGYDAVIAGTKPLAWSTADKLKVVSRVGVGLDNIDFEAAQEKGVTITYTPQAPSQAVAELTVGLITDLARGITQADHKMAWRVWERQMGRLISESTVGIVGVGRIGKRVAHLLSAYKCTILGHDIAPDHTFSYIYGLKWVGKESILRQSDFLTIHLPLTDDTVDWIDDEALKLMKPTAYLINTARGPIVNDEDLYIALTEGYIAGAALDVYDEEPYRGALCDLTHGLVRTCHMGAATAESRRQMEREAVGDCLRGLLGRKPHNEYRYHNR